MPPVQNGFGLIFWRSCESGISQSPTIVEKNRGIVLMRTFFVFARGIFLGGVTGVTVQKNVIRRTDCGGIVAHQDPGGRIPRHRIRTLQIHFATRSIVQSARPRWALARSPRSVPSLSLATGIRFANVQFPLILPTATNITIADNFTSSMPDAPESGPENMTGGAITGNTVASFALYPQLAVHGESRKPWRLNSCRIFLFRLCCIRAST